MPLVVLKLLIFRISKYREFFCVPGKQWYAHSSRCSRSNFAIGDEGFCKKWKVMD